MAIFFTVLKIIGISILSILGLLLFIILLVLFVPIRYRIFGEKMAESDFFAEIKITWLLHIINILAWYKEELFYRVRVFVFSVYKSDNLKKKPKNKESVKEAKEDIKKENDTETIEKNLEEINVESENSEIDVIDLEDSDIGDFPIYRGEDIAYDGVKNKEDDSVNETDELSFIDKFFTFTELLIDLIFNIDDKRNDIIDKLFSVKDNLDYYVDFINDERNRNVISNCIQRLSGVLKHISPKFIKGRLHIGYEDPYDMGKMLSIYSVLFPLIHDKIQLVPDYDKDIIEGNIQIKGRIRTIVLLYAAFKIYFNKDFRRMRKLLKRDNVGG